MEYQLNLIYILFGGDLENLSRHAKANEIPEK